MSDIDPAVLESEVVITMADQIADRVSRIKNLEATIEEKRKAAKIAEHEAMIKALRAELLDLTREYHDLTGSNWSDGTMRAAYVQAGESHKFKTEKVDEALAGLLGIQRDIDSLVSDIPTAFLIPLGEEKVLVKVDDLDAKAFSKADVLAYAKKAEETRLVAMREIALRAEAFDQLLKNLAAARSVGTTPEHIQISRVTGKDDGS